MNDHIIFPDDSGTWRREGNAFATAENRKLFESGEMISSRGGNFFDLAGTLYSPNFMIDRDYLNLDLFINSWNTETSCRLLIEGKTEFILSGKMGDCWKSYALDLRLFSGKKAQLIFRDAGSWESILAKNIRLSDEPANGTELISPAGECDFLDLCFTAESGKRYLLMPINLHTMPREYCFEINGRSGPYFQLPLAINGDVEYYTAFDLTEWNVQTLRLCSKSNVIPRKKLKDFSALFTLAETDPAQSARAECPKLHFTPFSGMCGDMVGFFFDGKDFHICYDEDPLANSISPNVCWGHAVSHDLVTWKKCPAAVRKGPDYRICSGSAVYDPENRSGLQDGDFAPLLLFYSQELQINQRYQPFGKTASFPKEYCTKIMVRYSCDNGKTFQDCEANPVLITQAPGGHDPKVFFHPESNAFVMVLHDRKGTEWGFAFYTSDDLLHWTFQSFIGDFWETPEIFPLYLDDDPGKKLWILQECLLNYRIGKFDGKRFDPVTEKISVIQGAYAPCHFTMPDSRIIEMAAVSGELSLQNGKVHLWGGATLPMDVSLRTTPQGPRLFYRPAAEILNQLKTEVYEENIDVEVLAVMLNGIKTQVWKLDLSWDTGSKFRITSGDRTIFECDGESNWHKLSMIFDTGRVDCFLDDGINVSTCLIPGFGQNYAITGGVQFKTCRLSLWKPKEANVKK